MTITPGKRAVRRGQLATFYRRLQVSHTEPFTLQTQTSAVLQFGFASAGVWNSNGQHLNIKFQAEYTDPTHANNFLQRMNYFAIPKPL